MPAGTHAARRNAVVDPQDAIVGSEPDEIDREAHPEGMDGAAMREQQALPGTQLSQADQSEQTRPAAMSAVENQAAGEVVSGQTFEAAIGGHAGSSLRPRFPRPLVLSLEAD